MSEFEDVQKLLRLKQYETPGKEYFEGFLDDFQNRQRSEILRQSSRSLFVERLATWFSGFGKEKWLLAGGLGYAVIMLTLYLKPEDPDPISRQPGATVVVEQLPGTMPVPMNLDNAGSSIPVKRTADGAQARSDDSSHLLNIDELDLIHPGEGDRIKEF